MSCGSKSLPIGSTAILLFAFLGFLASAGVSRAETILTGDWDVTVSTFDADCGWADFSNQSYSGSAVQSGSNLDVSFGQNVATGILGTFDAQQEARFVDFASIPFDGYGAIPAGYWVVSAYYWDYIHTYGYDHVFGRVNWSYKLNDGTTFCAGLGDFTAYVPEPSGGLLSGTALAVIAFLACARRAEREARSS